MKKTKVVSPSTEAPLLLDPVSAKRPKPELAEPAAAAASIPQTYIEKNERYMNDGMSQYTVQFLRKMAGLSKFAFSRQCEKTFDSSCVYTIQFVSKIDLYL